LSDGWQCLGFDFRHLQINRTVRSDATATTDDLASEIQMPAIESSTVAARLSTNGPKIRVDVSQRILGFDVHTENLHCKGNSSARIIGRRHPANSLLVLCISGMARIVGGKKTDNHMMYQDVYLKPDYLGM
jgi:hypothetical protein